MGLKVLVADPISEAGVELLEESGVEVDAAFKLSEDELRERLAGYDGLIVRSGTQVTARSLEGTDRLKVIGRAGVGVDNIDVEAATRRGIIVLNAPGGNTAATAEHTIAMMMSLARRVPHAHISLSLEQQWERHRFTGVQVGEKTLGVVGLGRVGSAVARRANGLGMRVLGYDPYISEERARSLNVTLATVDEICREADFITVHTPLTKATEGLIGRREFGLMKPGVRIINCARGGIIDEEALVEALDQGRVAGAALDVFTEEPPVNSPLLGRDDVVVTPHLGASTYEAQVNVAVEVVRDVLRALRGEPVVSAVNIPALPREQLEAMRPYLDLSERLGRLYTELFEGARGRVEVVYCGEVADFDVAPLTNAALKGMLEPVLQEQVNYVNASVLAKERELRVSEVKEPHGDGTFSSLIALRHRDAESGETRQVAGTLTGNDIPTLTFIDDYRVNVNMPGYLLIAHNIDRPGVIGQVGTLLGKHAVNIAYMQVGRKDVGSHAVMVLGLDNPVTAEVMQELEQLKDLWNIRLAHW